MLADMSAGSLMYYGREIDEINQKENHSGGYPTYHILEETEFHKVVTLEIQNDQNDEGKNRNRNKIKPKKNWIQRLLNR